MLRLGFHLWLCLALWILFGYLSFAWLSGFTRDTLVTNTPRLGRSAPDVLKVSMLPFGFHIWLCFVYLGFAWLSGICLAVWAY